ncbi:MAG TPA: 50S ribosomal protein L32 [Planctomycetota bacterium]
MPGPGVGGTRLPVAFPVMANPKRRHSKRRARIGHAAIHKAPVSLRPCDRCSANGPPHTVCDNCGHYAGREIVEKDVF